MHRRRYVMGFLLAPILFVLVAMTAACGGGPEDLTITQFFTASRTRDNVTLGNIALASFDARTHGQVTTFKTVSVGPEQTEPINVKETAVAYRQAVTDDEAFTKEKNAFQKENIEAIERIVKAEQAGTTLKGKDAELQKQWSDWRERAATSQKKVSEARQKANQQRPVVELSTMDPQNPIDVTEYDGTIHSKDVTIDARVKMPEGETVNKTLVLTLQKAVLKGADKEIDGKWVITAIKEAPAGAQTSS